MKDYGLTIKSLLAFIIGFMCCFEHAFAAQVEIFAEGLTCPTGLAINIQTRQLYVNCGENGNLWTISINNDASSGGIELITSGFTPKLDIALDSEMNVYGVVHGDDNVYRLSSTTGEMTECDISYPMGTGISIEPPGLNSNRIFYSLENEAMEMIYISSYNSNSNASRDAYLKIDASMRFMDWRKGLNEIIGTYGEHVVSINPNNGSCNTIASGFIAPHGIAQDDAGNIYIADTGAGTITQITSLGQIDVIVAGLNSPIGLVYDSETNKLFVSENIEGKIYSIDMGSEDICLQVITFAQNPVTQQWAAFPTPCDVPLGWEISYDMPNWYPSSGGEDSNIYPPIGMDINNPDAILVLTGEAVYTAPYGNSTCVYGTSDPNTIMIEKGAAVNLQSFNGANTIMVDSLSSLFTVCRSGSTVIFEDTDGTIIRIPATNIAQTFTFKDRSLDLVVVNNQVMLSGQVIQAIAYSIE